MKMSRTIKSIMILSVVLLAGTTLAFAHGGWGPGDCGRYQGKGGPMAGPGYGGRMMDRQGDGPCPGGNRVRQDLSDEQMAKLDEARDQFRKETQELRGQIEIKSVALRNEMIKDKPDSGKAMKLQKEISGLRADFDEKKLQHRLEVHKIAPETFQGRSHGRRASRGGGGYGCRQ